MGDAFGCGARVTVGLANIVLGNAVTGTVGGIALAIDGCADSCEQYLSNECWSCCIAVTMTVLKSGSLGSCGGGIPPARGAGGQLPTCEIDSRGSTCDAESNGDPAGHD